MSRQDTAGGGAVSRLRFPGLDARTNAVWERLYRVARSRLPVLILGETGTGKELAAEWVYEASQRGSALLKINCASLSESVVESELFGHERGAFTGAHTTRHGIFEAADGGSLFLDEVGELSLATQAKLLRVLEAGEIVRLGSNQARKVDVRIIAATHRVLPERIAAGQFREDLYFRLNGVSAWIPPLRERPSEILPLARFFVERSAAAAGLNTPALSSGAEAALMRHRWPGNVRELRHVMERALALSGAEVISAECLELQPSAVLESSPVSSPAAVSVPSSELQGAWQQMERERIEVALAQTHGNQTLAASLLGISRRTLTNKLNRHGLPRPRKRSR